MSSRIIFHSSGAVSASQRAFVEKVSAEVVAGYTPNADEDPETVHVFAHKHVTGFKDCVDNRFLMSDFDGDDANLIFDAEDGDTNISEEDDAINDLDSIALEDDEDED